MAGRASVALADVRAALRDVQREMRERLPSVAKRVIRPKRFEKYDDGTTRVSQLMAFFFLGPLIVVSFALLSVFHNVMAGVLSGGAWSNGSAQTGLFEWLVTAITLAAFMLAAWSWFQFVRTSGFGFFSWKD